MPNRNEEPAMTDQPTLAPLITMDEARLRAIKSRVPIEYDMSRQRIVDLLAELAAQRRARVQEAARAAKLVDWIRQTSCCCGGRGCSQDEESRKMLAALERLLDQPDKDKA